MNKLVLALLVISLLLIVGCPRSTPVYTPDSISSPSSAEPQQPPNAPSNLVGQSISHSTINLTWMDNSDNEDGFKIYRNGSSIGSIEPNSTSYQDTGLQPSETYLYDVRAYNEAGESGSSCSVKTLNPPLNVTINYIGVKFDHDPSELFQQHGDIGLVVVITDGNQIIQEVIPPSGTFALNDYEVIEINQRVFNSGNVGEYLRISVLAYDDDPESMISDVIKVALPILGPIMGLPDAAGIVEVINQYEQISGKPLFENEDDRVGYFEGFWRANESWGIGQHNAVGSEDLRVWLTIWSDSQPQPISKPVLLPNIAIQNVNVPSQVQVGQTYNYNVTIDNNEAHAVSITLKIHSSVTGDVSIQNLTIAPNSTINVPQTTAFEPAGVRVVTYTVLFGNKEVDSLSKTVEAISAIPTITFNGWYVGGSPVTTAKETDTVTARFTFSGGDSGTYTILIRRDISLGADQTVQQTSFSYNGSITVQQVSFVPPYATGEASTRGYHVDILKDGVSIWSMTNSYPPRLRVETW